MLKVIADPLEYFSHLMADGAEYRWFRILWNKVLILNNPVSIEHVFQTNHENYRKSSFHKGLKPLLGNGIFLSEGDLWNKQRREMAPFFSGKHLRNYTNDMVVSADKLVERIRLKVIKGESVDIQAESMWFTLDVVLRSMFKDPRSEIADSMRQSLGLLLHDAEDRIWNLVTIPQKLKLKYSRSYINAVSFLNTLVNDMLELKQSQSNDSADFDVISTLIKKYDLMDAVEQELLRDQILSLLLAGHETSANALTWAFYEIAKSQTIKDKARADIEKIPDGQELNFDNVQNLSYLLAIFQESLRLYPPVWTMSRETNAADEIPTEHGGVIKVKKNTLVMLSPYIMHRQKSYWPNPEIFNPERFLEQSGNAYPKHAYIPYGGGARLCLGHKFANIEGVIAIAKVLQSFDFTYVGSVQPKPEPLITLRPNIPVMLDFKVRGNQQRPACESISLSVNHSNAVDIDKLSKVCPFSFAKG